MSKSITQDIISARRSITYESCERRQAGAIISKRFLEDPNLCLGISVRRTNDGSVKSLVFSSLEHAVVISTGNKIDLQPQDGIFQRIATKDSGVTIGGFHLPRLALLVSRDFNIPFRGVDLSTLLSPSSRSALSPMEFMEKRGIFISNSQAFENIWDCQLKEPNNDNAILRAWMCAYAMKDCYSKLRRSPYVETMRLSRTELLCLSKLLKESDILYYQEPTKMIAEFNKIEMTKDREIAIENSRYKTRIRRGQRLVVVVIDAKGKRHPGRVRRVEGKTSYITVHDRVSTPTRVEVQGRRDPTNAERERDEFILHLLQGRITLNAVPFIKYLWFQTTLPEKRAANLNLDRLKLNNSQKAAISAMIGETPVTVVQGPPGTGKTTVIAHATRIWSERTFPTWIAAQSNVAVKNIAEKLAKKVHVDFKLIVSKEFHHEWHEHLYLELKENLIRSDEFPNDKVAAERHLGGSRVILTTISMLSNPLLEHNGTFDVVPMERLVIDEASQINVFEYMPLFAKFKKLRKVCFFGDPNQLAPFGKETVTSVESIFDIKHFENSTYFLNTQYRMPTPIGQFISAEVYRSRLHSEHSINTKKCLAFIHADGKEEMHGKSQVNAKECQTVIHLVKNYYQRYNFVVITGYDAQRALIEKQLKDQNLPWESRVFNVDSFQGNEADIVIVSVVRTERPGFLDNWNRMNVMLTRCKRGMVIVANRTFMSNQGKNTLLGRLAQFWINGSTEKDQGWFDWRLISERKAKLPGESLYRELDAATPKQGKYFDVSKIVQKSRRPPPDWKSLTLFPPLPKMSGLQYEYSADSLEGTMHPGKRHQTPNEAANLPSRLRPWPSTNTSVGTFSKNNSARKAKVIRLDISKRSSS